jgi:DNA-binding transcriptional MerR regulator
LKTVSEVANEIDVPTHLLRFWEHQFPQLKPMKKEGRRFYCPEDIALLRAIRTLLFVEGYTIKQARKALPGVPDLQKAAA